MIYKNSRTCITVSLTILFFFLCGIVNAEKKVKTQKLIDNFNKIKGWTIIKPAGTELKLMSEKGLKEKCMTLSYDLGQKKLYVVLAKDKTITLPENYRFIFNIKAISPDNNLEFKLLDENGNTYWRKWENFVFPKSWKKIVINKADLSYAWGAKPDAVLKKVKKIEFAISSGKGGRGKIYIDELNLVTLPSFTKGFKFIKNSSFEKQEADWKKSGNAKHIEPHNWHAHTGKWSFGIGNDKGPGNAVGEISQEVNVKGSIKKGDLFIFKMWMKSEDNYSGRASLKLVFTGAKNKILKSYQSKVLFGKFDWKKLVVSGLAPSGSRKVIVKCRSTKNPVGKGGTFLWVDTASVDSPVFTASSSLKSVFLPKNVMKKGKWHSKYSDKQWIKIDFRYVKKFTGLSIDWDKDYANNYEILISIDGKKWNSIYKAKKDKDVIDRIYLDETYAQFIKIKCGTSFTGKGFGIKNIDINESTGLVTLQKYYKLMAEQMPDYYPRWMNNQQAYWTIVGVERDTKEAAICEDGTIEPYKRGFTIAPFLYQNNRLITRGSVKITHSLENIYLPIPSVKWKNKDIEMKIKMFAYGKENKSSAYVKYIIKNTANKDVTGSLFLCIRPFQIYPPWQGGTDSFARIYEIKYRNNVINIDNKYRIFSLTKPDGFGSIAGSSYFKFPFKIPAPPELKGDITGFINKGTLPEEKNIKDNDGFVSSAIKYDYILKPGEIKEVFVAIPFHKKDPDLNAKMPVSEIKDKYNNMFEKRVAYWESKLNRVEIDIPEQDLIHLMKANVGYNLITKDGPALQPGARSYDKAWWRDGSIQASSLMKMGLKKEAKEFFNWMVSFQYDTGEVPPIIDNKAEDPLWELKPPHNLKEYDSQGELIWSVLEYYYFSGDKKFLKEKWKNVYKSLRFLESLRKQRLTDEYNVDDLEKRRFYGILPQSRSHEGYWFAHSYWDDWWALKGWKDAKKIAQILGKKKSIIKWIEKEYNSFFKDLAASIKATAKFKKVNYISGCAEKGDFDPTSVAVAINYSGELKNIEKYLQPYLTNTFERYWKELETHIKPGASFHYTPYEARNAPVFLYMGQKEKALALLRFLLRCSRPYKWFQLAEVVNSDYHLAYYVGDIPHAWVGSEIINGIRALFVYEEDDKLIIGAGIDEKWLERESGISVKKLPTYFGKINYTIKKTRNTVKVKISGKVKPEKGFVFKSPFLKKEIRNVRINGRKWKRFTGNEVLFKKLPVEIVINY